MKTSTIPPPFAQLGSILQRLKRLAFAVGLTFFAPFPVVAANITWTGAVNGTWDTSTANWTPGSLFHNGDSVTFSDTGANATITLAGVLSPASLTYASTINRTIVGNASTNLLSGSMSLTKNGSSTLTLLGKHAFTGAIVINAGILRLGEANTLPDYNSVTLNGGTLHTGGFSEYTGNFVLGGNAVIDMGAGASVLRFGLYDGNSWQGNLHVWNWTGQQGTDGGTDQVHFVEWIQQLSAAQLASIQFFSDSGTTAIGSGAAFIGSELVPAAPGSLCKSAVGPGADLKYIVPNAGFPPTNWFSPSYVDGQWPAGSNCLGYDGDPICDNLILYSTFDTANVDTTNRIITDVSGPTLHNGTYALNAVGIPLAGQIGQSVQFFGNGTSLVNYADHTELDPKSSSYSFSIWINPQNNNGTQVIYRKTNSGNPPTAGYMLTLDGDTGASFRAFQVGVSTVVARTTQAIPINAWTHLLVTIDRGTNEMKLYRNSSLTDTKPIPTAMVIQAPGNPLLLANAVGATSPFAGFEDDFAIWGRLLTPAEVTSVYTAGAQNSSFKTTQSGGSGNEPYLPCITTDVKGAMKGVNSSLYIRIPFTIPDASLVSRLELSIKYDDGFVAYLNGTEVARRNAPTPLAFNSAATTDRPDLDALTPEVIDLTANISLLVTGAGNVLAIHGLNSAANDPRFLICPELCYEETETNDCYKTTNDREFWLCFPGNAPDETANPLRLALCIAGAAGTTGFVEIPGLSFNQTYTIPASGVVAITLPKAASLDTSNLVENKGVHLTASADVTVYGRTREDYTTDTFLAIPLSCLGTEYLALGYKNVWTGYPDLNGSQFGIVAQADNTRVTITPKVTTDGHVAGSPYQFILNHGQTYLLRNRVEDGDPFTLDDLSGSEIKSDKPIGVLAGHQCANINGQTFFCDTILEQLLPVPAWANQYVTSPLKTRLGPDTIRVVAAENNTNLFVDGVPKATLNRGEIYESVEAPGRVIIGSKPILVAQYANSSDYDGVADADPFQINIQPVQSWLDRYLICTPLAAEFGANYANVIARASADLSAISWSPAPVSLGPVTSINGGAFYYQQVTLSPATLYSVVGKSFGLTQYGWDEYDSYGNSGGMGFDDFLPPSFGQCPPHLTIPCTQGAAGCFGIVPNFRQLFGLTDNCCPEDSISYSQDPPAGTQLAEGDYQVVLVATDCNNNTVSCVIQLHVRSNWQQNNFSSAYSNPAMEETVWGWSADPDGDGLKNRLEYALGTDPNLPNSQFPNVEMHMVTSGGKRFLELTYRRRNDDPSLDYLPECSGGLGLWSNGPGHFEFRSSTPDTDANFDRITERCLDGSPDDGVTKFFLRLRVQPK